MLENPDRGLAKLIEAIGDDSQVLDSLKFYPNLPELMEYLMREFEIEWWVSQNCYIWKDEPHYKAQMIADVQGDILYDEEKENR